MNTQQEIYTNLKLSPKIRYKASWSIYTCGKIAKEQENADKKGRRGVEIKKGQAKIEKTMEEKFYPELPLRPEE